MESLSLEAAAARIRAVDTLAVPLGPGQPGSFLHALAGRDEFENLQVFGALLLDLYPLFAKNGVRLLSGFLGPAERALRDAGHDVHFVPGDFRRFATVIEQIAPRVMATAVAPAGPDGRYSLSLHAGATVEALRGCGRDPERVLLAEVNPALPRTQGLPPEHTHDLGPDEIDLIVMGNRPVPSLEDPPPSQVERAIAAHVTPLIPDGATLQTGIGGIPSAVAALLADGSGGDYGIHSEMFTSGLMRLHRAGKVTNRRKGIYQGISICTFALGTQALHDWLHENEEVRFLPVDFVNDPSTIAHNRNMIAINSALSIDLAGQVVADTIAGHQHSGIGGHEDFVGGASLENDDHSMVCLPSTARVGQRVISRIQARLPLGSIVTTPRHQVDLVVTEYGAAELRGRTTEERARALIEIAHPDARDALRAGEDAVEVS